MKYQNIAIFILLLLPVAASAQFSDSVHYYAGLTSTGTVNNTNTSSSFITSEGGKFSVRRKDVSLNSTTTYIYGKERRVTNNDFATALDFNLYKTLPHFYYWGLANYQFSYSLKINNQAQTGVGVAYNIVDRKNANLNISDGVLYDNSDIYLSDTVREIYSTFRNSLRVSFRWNIKDMVTLSGMSFYQPSLSSGTDYIIKSNLGMSVKVYKWLSFTTAFTYNRFNRTKKENTLFTYGLTAERYFK